MIYETFLKRKVTSLAPEVLKTRVYFSDKALDASEEDVHRVINVQSGDVVLSCCINVVTACPADSMVDLGYGSVTGYWGNALKLDAVGPAMTILTGTKTWNPYVLENKNSYIDEINVDGAMIGDLVSLYPSVDICDLTVSGHVVCRDQILCQLSNNTGGALDLGATVFNAVVNKAPYSIMPLAFSSADTIDLKVRGLVDISSGVIDVYAMILRLAAH